MLSDEALFDQLVAGQVRAFDTLYERYERPLFTFIRRYLHDAHESEDVFHESFMAVLREHKEGRTARSFRAWLFQVARNLCLNRLRSRRRAARAVEINAPSEIDPGNHPEEALVHNQTAQALSGAVARLPSSLAEVYDLRANGMSYEEIAQVLAIPIGTVKSRIHEMIERLRQEMK